jgi:hypothetical protein
MSPMPERDDWTYELKFDGSTYAVGVIGPALKDQPLFAVDSRQDLQNDILKVGLNETYRRARECRERLGEIQRPG